LDDAIDLIKKEEFGFVILILPATKETERIIDMRFFNAMKPHTVFMNIGRGITVNEADLVSALDKKIIGGAWMDVTVQEPLESNNPLWARDNVLLTQHRCDDNEDVSAVENCGKKFNLILDNFIGGTLDQLDCIDLDRG